MIPFRCGRVGLTMACVTLALLAPSPMGAETAGARYTAGFWPDCDGDGFGDPNFVASPAPLAQCGPTECACVRNDTDCDDSLATVYPEAPQLCDGLNNDCADPIWPDLPSDEADADGDGYSVCTGDCNDDFPSSKPGGFETCNAFDDDCDTVVDEGCDCTCVAPGFGTPTIVTDVYDELSGSFPSIVWTGSGYGLSWADVITGVDGALGFGRLDPNGTAIPPLRHLGAVGIVGGSEIAWSGSWYGVVWSSSAAGPGGVDRTSFSRFSSDGGSYAGLLLSSSQVSGYSVVFTSSEFAIAWSDWYLGGVVFTRVATSGEQLGGVVLVMPVEDTLLHAPKLAWNGAGFGIVWQGSCLAFARLDAAGARIGDPVCVAPSVPPRSLTWTGDGYMAVWESDTDGNGAAELWLTLTDSFGTPLDDDIRLWEGSQDERHPALAWTGSEFGLVWEARVGGEYRLRFARVGSGGQIVGATIESTFPAREPDLVWTGTQFGIAYQDNGSVPGYAEIAYVPVVCGCSDDDGDGITVCDGDCDDGSMATYPGAPELCDGMANDCDAPGWPALPAQEVDADQDGFMACQGDCDDAAAAVHPGQQEVCDGVDDDCDGLTDEDESGEDADGDGVFGVCDNCPLVPNPAQSDIDGDSEGDGCDLNDGFTHLLFSLPTRLMWDPEVGVDAWNGYCGDLDELRATGAYTQPPGANPLADRVCGLPTPEMDDFASPPEGKVAFYLVTGVQGEVEGTLGTDSFGQERPNGAPCP